MRKLIVIAIMVLGFVMISVAIVPYFIPTDTYRKWVENKVTSDLAARVTIGKFHLRFIPYPGYTIRDFALISTDPPHRGVRLFSAKRVEGDLSLFGLMGGRIITNIKIYDARMDYRVSGGVSNLGQMFGWNTGVGMVQPDAEKSAGEAAVEGYGEPSVDTEVKEEPTKAIPVSPDGEVIQGIPMPVPEGDIDEVEGQESSSWMENIIIRRALAGDASRQKAAYSLTLRSVDVVGGRLNIFLDGENTPVVVDNVDLAVRNLSSAESAGSRNSGRVLGADVRMNGSIFGSRAPNLSVSGRFMHDSSRKTIGVSGAKLYILGAQASADISVNLGFLPRVFDIHIATPSITSATITALYPEAAREILADLAWQGTAALDISMKGTKEACELELVLDATTSNIKLGDLFSKGAGLPLKISSSSFMRPDVFVIREADINLGEDRLTLKGDVKRDDFMTISMRVAGEGLDDSVLKGFFPKFVIMDSFEDMKLSIDLAGALAGGKSPLKANGKFKAKRSQVAGIPVEELEGVFTGGKSEFTFPSIRGNFAGGTFSGNASMISGDRTEYRFDGVVERMQAEKMNVLGGELRGQSSLIVHGSTDGSDPLSVSNNIKLAGSLLIPQGSWQAIRICQGVFSTETWKGLEALAGTSLDAAWKEKLSSADENFSDFNASYELSGDVLNVSSVSWNNPEYAFEGLKGSITFSEKSKDVAGDITDPGIRAEGVLILPKTVAMQLIVDVSARKKLLDGKDRLVLPVIIGGTLKSPTFQLDHVKLMRQVEEEPLADEPKGEPAKIIRGDEGKIVPGKGVKTKDRKATGTGRAGSRKSYRRRTKEEKKDTDEILKVIIGH